MNMNWTDSFKCSAATFWKEVGLMLWFQATPAGEGCNSRFFFDSQYDIGHFPSQPSHGPWLTHLSGDACSLFHSKPQQSLPPQEGVLSTWQGSGSQGEHWAPLARPALASRSLRGLLIQFLLIEHPWAKGTELGTVESWS